MPLDPHELIKELRQFSFFSSFDESLLKEISPLFSEIEFARGQEILAEGQINDKLYFLRSGNVDVFVEGERVNVLSDIGEVLGEISVLSGKMVTATLKAQGDVRCFMISAGDLSQIDPARKDHFQFLLYRIWASVLSDRLLKTNEKAKMYEVTARELSQAKKDLEQMTSAQLNFLRSSSNAPAKKVLLLEPNKKQQNIIKSAFGGTGVELLIASTVEEAQSIYQPDLQVIFCEETTTDFLIWSHQQNFSGSLAMIQSLDFNFELLQKIPFVQNVISRNPEDRAGTVKSLITTLTKIIYKDFFGPQKYLSWGTEIREKVVQHSGDREPLREALLEDFKELGMRSSLLDRVQVATEEMMMNAVYDAPVDKDGKSLYNHLPRSTAVQLKPQEYARLKYGSDGNILAVAVEDPFGALTKDIVIKYLNSCYNGAAGSLNVGKGGAGRGLHQILESCDFTIFNVKPGQKTEVIGLFDIDASLQKKDNRPLFQFFFDQ